MLVTLSVYFHSKRGNYKQKCFLIEMFILWVFFCKKGKVTFSWKSLATAYAVFFYVVMTGVVFIVGRERMHILSTTQKFDDKIYAIIFVIFLVPHFWVCSKFLTKKSQN